MRLTERLAERAADRLDTLWVVGGCVRDRLLGRPSADIDLIVPDAVEAARWFARVARATFVLLDDGHGTARIVARDGSGEYLDFCEPQGTLDEDLRARDFTVNAVACTLADWLTDEPHWLDPTGGLDDLAHGRLRSTHDGAMAADPLRVLRGHRLAAGLDLVLDEATQQQMRAALPGLARVAAERIRTEWLRLLALRNAPSELLRCAALGTLGWLLPEAPDPLAETLARAEAALAVVGAEPHFGPWLDEGETVALLRFGALLPADDTAPTARDLTRRFALSRAQQRLLALAREPWGTAPEELALGLHRLGLDLAAPLLGGAARGTLTAGALAEALARLRTEWLPRWQQPPLVTGHDLQTTLGYTPGPRFKACLDHLRIEQILGRLSDPAAALAAAREVMESDG
ncbi:MAG: CCA tRNA nucleotidyltransferase [Armatimonadetes bacterium]|nr:CCA tRNA nucleotidyltransferase [Armatimonadota bacterium]